MLDYDPNARAPDSAWLIVLLGALFASLLLWHADARGQTAVANMAWSCADQSKAGQSVGNTSGNCGSQRWDLGDSGHLVAGCAGNCSSWTQAIWVPWSSSPANVFGCPGPRVPGQWSSCAGERFLPRAQIAVGAALPPPPPPPPPSTAKASVPTGLVLMSLATGSVTGTWNAVATRVDGSPISAYGYSMEQTNGPFAGNGESNTATTVTIDGLPTTPGANFYCYGVRTLALGAADQSSDLSDPPVCITLNAWARPADPRCNPPVFTAAFREATTVDAHVVKAWACDDAQGYQWNEYGANPAVVKDKIDCVPDVLYAVMTLSNVQAAWRACVDRPLSPTEDVVADELAGRWHARFVVSAIAETTACPSGCRPVYLRNADGARGARVVIGGVNQSIASGLRCDGRQRLLGTTTRYNGVSGLQSTTGQTLPPNSFTVCSIQNPPASGWPP